MRGTGRTKLFKQLKSLLPEQFGDQTFAFFEDPLGELPHPLLWAHEEKNLDPISRLLKLWATLNDFNIKRLLPGLNSHDVVVTDGYGLNALLYATACVGSNVEDDEATTRMHHHLVRARVLEQGIHPPEYFITMANSESQVGWLQSNMAALTLTVDECLTFIKKEERIIHDYFSPSTGQSGHMLESSLSIDEMTQLVVNTIHNRLNQSQAA